MKILLTGGTGVIGTGAIPAMLKAGHEIRLLSRHADRDVSRFPAGVESFTADLGEPGSLPQAVQGCEAIVHIAGIVEERPPEITFEKINVGGTRALCAAGEAAGRPYFLHVSSLGADRGESEYHRSKLRAEQIVQRYHGPWLILRPGAVYGPGDETISLLLKFIRHLPAVPIVDDGTQPFQPLWFEDFGAVLAEAVTRRELAGQILEVAGPDITSTVDVLDRLARITDRNPPRLPVPTWLAQVGASSAESAGGFGEKLLRQLGLSAPINSAKLQMLLEGSVLGNPQSNALISAFTVAPTPLQDGLEQLADQLPERPPGEGVGAVERSVYFAEIEPTTLSPAELLSLVLERITEVMPLEFAAEPGAPTRAELGVTMTGAIPGRGHFQVRLDERTETRATFVTIEGHPLAGVLTFSTDATPRGVRFAIELVAQSANVADWLAMRTFGRAMQSSNWRAVVRRVIALSGGEAPQGVQKQHETLSEEDVTALTGRVRELVARREREETEQEIGSAPDH
ncbi:NAD-dependent epimerase/dehydratase family protein [Opitutus terrae]|uniref:NAD-dependent epimerase/dehydratase n=1 Tax=Opitutus terrae (strain DSM 11246 / JCM 15787 / PB90-1) TaxID=452637 RepID=B1ZQ71_OPITP|nr:NAD-dependent epimerase/dehydratase family protein [Opitutus terrae]ACB77792.1 NAD-dependent epimerase/dehydratase [Opitutus terrae PB90-1]